MNETYDINFILDSYNHSHEDVVDKKEFVNFLCDMEIFHWSSKEYRKKLKKHQDNIFIIKFGNIFRVYLQYLCNLLATDLTLIGVEYSDTKYEDFGTNTFEDFMIDRPIYMDTKGAYDYEFAREILEIRKLNNLPVKYLYYPFVITQTKRNFFYCSYSNQIFDNTKRYVFIQSMIRYPDNYHFVFLFIDHKDKIVEFYDPYVSTNTRAQIEFTFLCLKKLFPEYKINDFWNLKSIQDVELIEKDEYAYCVIWGTMLIHLKLLNMNKSIKDIESKLLKHCYENNLSVYEVMLNYSQLMRRIIPENPLKFIILEEALLNTY